MGSGIQLFDGMYRGMGDALGLAQARQQLTASNLSNVDTPGYLAKEVPFRELLGEFMQKAKDGEPADVLGRVEDSISELPAPDFALDGNSVDVEREGVLMEQNKLFYNAVAGGIGRRLALLRFAASDGKA